MLERAAVRCPVCRTAVPLDVLWVTEEVCPGCLRPLAAARQRPRPTGVLGQTLAALQAREPGAPRPDSRPGL